MKNELFFSVLAFVLANCFLFYTLLIGLTFSMFLWMICEIIFFDELSVPFLITLSLSFDFDLDVCILYLIKSLLLLLLALVLFRDLFLLRLPLSPRFYSSKADVSIFFAVILPLEFNVCFLFALLELVVSLRAILSQYG